MVQVPVTADGEKPFYHRKRKRIETGLSHLAEAVQLAKQTEYFFSEQ